MRYAQFQLANAHSMTGSFKSYGVDLNQTVLYSVQAVWTGTPVGTLAIEVSNDNVAVAAITPSTNPLSSQPVGSDPAANVVNWTTYTGSSTAAGGAAGNFLWNVLEAGYRWVRVSYTASSSTGTCTIQYAGKSI